MHAECSSVACDHAADPTVAVNPERLAAERASDADLPPAGLKSGHLLRDLPRRGKHERPGQLRRRIGGRAGMLARRSDRAAPRARVDVDVRIDTALTNEFQFVKAFEQVGPNLRSFADKDHNFSVSQPFS